MTTALAENNTHIARSYLSTPGTVLQLVRPLAYCVVAHAYNIFSEKLIKVRRNLSGGPPPLRAEEGASKAVTRAEQNGPPGRDNTVPLATLHSNGVESETRVKRATSFTRWVLRTLSSAATQASWDQQSTTRWRGRFTKTWPWRNRFPVDLSRTHKTPAGSEPKSKLIRWIWTILVRVKFDVEQMDGILVDKYSLRPRNNRKFRRLSPPPRPPRTPSMLQHTNTVITLKPNHLDEHIWDEWVFSRQPFPRNIHAPADKKGQVGEHV